jgi:hypothetical protein
VSDHLCYLYSHHKTNVNVKTQFSNLIRLSVPLSGNLEFEMVKKLLLDDSLGN